MINSIKNYYGFLRLRDPLAKISFVSFTSFHYLFSKLKDTAEMNICRIIIMDCFTFEVMLKHYVYVTFCKKFLKFVTREQVSL